MTTPIERLDREGYCVLRNQQATHDVASCFEGQKVRYNTTKAQVERLIEWLGATHGIRLHALKFRASNNNNNVDASQPHRDVMQGSKFENVYTMLFYVDNAALEVYPGSHRAGRFATLRALKPRRVPLSRGDVVVFHSSLMHRGVYSDRGAGDNRRVLQIFDCVTDKRLHGRIYNRLKEKENKAFNGIMKGLSRQFPKILVAAGMYINVVCDRRVAYRAAGIPRDAMISFEGAVPRIDASSSDESRIGNLWYLLDTEASHDITGRQAAAVTFGEASVLLAPPVLLLAVVALLVGIFRK
ncbi:MAG: hypothetical protein CL902_00790 [Dehalococcoidia bacterium]|nr:hypothetical protein [Dehalococcoidia bacterium]